MTSLDVPAHARPETAFHRRHPIRTSGGETPSQQEENVEQNAIGPDFLTLQVRDLERARRFYTEVVGFAPTESKVPTAAVFATSPIRLALRQATVDLDAAGGLGWGVVIWIKAEDPDRLAKRLEEQHVTITKPPCDGFCGREFQFRDPEGYELTVYEGSPYEG
jgi:predicted enzyme related to lactoylglutathione lyase